MSEPLPPSQIEVSPLRSAERATIDEQYTRYHRLEVELDETIQAVLAVVDRVKPRRIVFDSLSEMKLLARDPLRYRRQILALKELFSGRDDGLRVGADGLPRRVDRRTAVCRSARTAHGQ